MPPDLNHHDGNVSSERNWQSVRTILDALILAGIIWIVSSQLDSRKQAAQDRQDSRVQAATIIAQVANIQFNIADVPALRDKVMHIEAVQTELLRRQAGDDSLHAQLNHFKSTDSRQ